MVRIGSAAGTLGVRGDQSNAFDLSSEYVRVEGRRPGGTSLL
jgi:hypothetical protein